MAKGIINRFKVMDVSRGAVLTGHVVSTVLRTAVALAAVIGVAFLMGFSPDATFGQWLAVIGVLVLAIFAVSWLTIALGLAAKTAESAGFATVPLIMLPFFSSAIVPAEKMGPGVREFAEYQPFTPIIESVRGFLGGTPSYGHTVAAVAWSVGIAVVGYVWARARFNKRA
jgi:ABC-2 type transport system permease protein